MNPIRAPFMETGETLRVHSLFATIQGEGPHAGVPAVFLRLGGCNLACGFCDTDFEPFLVRDREDILKEIQSLAKNTLRLVVITGGEPFLHPLAPLCEALLQQGFRVQIETNGTLYRPIPEAVEIVCSPKNQGRGYVAPRPDLLARVTAWKILISASDPAYQVVPSFLEGCVVPVYLQPMDEEDETKNKTNRALVVKLALEHGHRVSLQLHKNLGIP